MDTSQNTPPRPLRQLRIEYGLTQGQLAEAAGMSRSTVSMAEGGVGHDSRQRRSHINYDTARRIARVFGLAVDEIEWTLPPSTEVNGLKPGQRRGPNTGPIVAPPQFCAACYLALPVSGVCDCGG